MDSPLKGKVLVAAAELKDPNFVRAVVLIVQHDENGAMGLVINRPLETTVQEAWTQVSSVPYPNDSPLYYGGPCEGPLIVLHRDSARGQMEVAEGIWLSSDADAVKNLVDESVEPMKFFVGYSGWSSAQLESELLEGSWILADIDSSLLLATPGDVWDQIQAAARKAVRHAVRPAVDPKFIPPDPSVN
jgi:putative transcriptional regulator